MQFRLPWRDTDRGSGIGLLCAGSQSCIPSHIQIKRFLRGMSLKRSMRQSLIVACVVALGQCLMPIHSVTAVLDILMYCVYNNNVLDLILSVLFQSLCFVHDLCRKHALIVRSFNFPYGKHKC